MPPAPIPGNEADRLDELERYAIVSTPPEVTFDRITKLATHLFRCPIALFSFVAEERKWFKSCIGLSFGEGPRTDSFCAWAILNETLLVVPMLGPIPAFPIIHWSQARLEFVSTPAHL